MLHVLQPEAGDLAGDAADELGTPGRLQHPVEEVGLDGPGDAGLAEWLAAEQVRRLRQRHRQHPYRQRLGDDGEIGVLQEEVVGIDRRAVDDGEQVRPQPPLQFDLRQIAHGPPQGGEPGQRPPAGETFAAELEADDRRVREQVGAERDGRIEPDQQAARLDRVGPVAGQRRENALVHLIGQELGAVGGDADEPLAGFAFPLARIAAQPLLRVPPLAAQVALELEDGKSEQRIGTAAHLRQGPLEMNFAAAGTEAGDEQLVNQRPDLLVSGTARHFDGDFSEAACRQRRHGACG